MRARELDVIPCRLADVRRFVEQHHYAHSVNGVKVAHCFAVGFKGELVGAAIYGAMSTTAWRRFSTDEAKVLELRRFVLVDEAARNSESYVIAKTLRWLRRNTDAEVVVSYADPHYGHRGTIYHASNFHYLGLTSPDKGFSDPETGKVYHSRALRTKHRGEYKPFVRRLRARLDSGLLEIIELPGKHCFTFQLRAGRPG